MGNEKTKHLLNQVGSLLKSYDKIAKATGENFNIFTVMGMESNEVKTHSAIIGELLNPKGSHGLGDKPLRLFIKLIVEPLYKDNDEELANKFSFNYENTHSYVEDFAGKINEKATEGGRIDIVIKDNKNKVFLIENKIYAGEQKNQLIRYNNFYPEAPILFLTLDGKDSETVHKLEKDKDYFNVSYEKDILLWLEECVKEAVKFPMLREVIYQYINLIKKLTHQTINNELKMEISDLIKNNFLEASEIANNFNTTKNKIIDDFLCDVFKKIEENPINAEMKINFDGERMYGKNFNFLISKSENDQAYIYLRIDNNQIFYGITAKVLSNNIALIQDLKMKYSSLKNFKPGRTSIIYADDFPLKINDVKNIKEILDKREIKLIEVSKFIQGLLKDLFSYCENIEETLTITK